MSLDAGRDSGDTVPIRSLEEGSSYIYNRTAACTLFLEIRAHTSVEVVDPTGRCLLVSGMCFAKGFEDISMA